MTATTRRSPARLISSVVLILCLSACVSPAATSQTSGAAPLPAPASAASREDAAKFQRDRQAILAMAGDYRVKFDFIETVSFRDDYALAPPKVSGAREVIRVIEDRGDFISLQHILVVQPDGEALPIKHWRQDWQYEPERVLVFIGANAWEWRNIPETERKGKWSQTVYQVEDAPRYGALAAWTYDFGIPSWTPPHEWRPLPRRDMTTRDDYHAINAVNRHVITPLGWVHEQDNDKVILSSGEPELLVREIGVNTYTHANDFDVSVATDYWQATEAFWAGIRQEWETIAAEHDRFGLTVQGETEALYNPLLSLAGDVAGGRMDVAEATAEARAILRGFVTFDFAPLAERVAETPAIGDGS